MKTEQERAWAGDFGRAYNARSPGNEEANMDFFEKVLDVNNRTHRAWRSIHSILELGAGTGANLRAIKRLDYWPIRDFTAVELNLEAAGRISASLPDARVIAASILDWQPDRTWDFVFTKGLLIHINPDQLGIAYETIHRAAARWILIAEYYSPKPHGVMYRGQENLLWKRDFAGEMLDRYQDLHLVDYGFAYHRDQAPQDDLNWFLLEKKP